MRLRKGEIVIVAIILMSLALSLGCYWFFPNKIVTGFMGKGWSIWSGGFDTKTIFDADSGWMVSYYHKFFGTFIFVLLMIVIYIPYFAFARFKKRANDERYKYYDRPLILLFGWELFFQIFIAFWNFGHKWQIDLGRIMIVWFGAIFFLFADIITHAKPGWFISWRTKATLNNEFIWKKTHQTGGKWIKIGICLFAISMFFRLGMICSILSLPLVYGIYYIPIYPIIAGWKLKRLQQKQGNSDPAQQ